MVTLLFSGLDKNKGYKFYMFASRDATQIRTARYTIAGTKRMGRRITGGIDTDCGGTGKNHNVENICESDWVYPDEEGKILFTVSRATGDYIPLNIMKNGRMVRHTITISYINL